ncbi:MAG: hypothetical protein JSW13_04640 [Candidatus Aerophobus sp.]|nr:MAG: hypothetical protein JSW13_04640 [Candidatus Aerophobus sp.]
MNPVIAKRSDLGSHRLEPALIRTLKGAATRSALCSQQHGTSFIEYLPKVADKVAGLAANAL